jgi:hypothetical protein
MKYQVYILLLGCLLPLLSPGAGANENEGECKKHFNRLGKQVTFRPIVEEFIEDIKSKKRMARDDSSLTLSMQSIGLSLQEAKDFYDVVDNPLARFILLTRFEIVKDQRKAVKKIMLQLLEDYKDSNEYHYRGILALSQLSYLAEPPDITPLQEFISNVKDPWMKYRALRTLEKIRERLHVQTGEPFLLEKTSLGEEIKIKLEETKPSVESVREFENFLSRRKDFLWKEDYTEIIDLSWSALKPYVAIKLSIADYPAFNDKDKNFVVNEETRSKMHNFCRARLNAFSTGKEKDLPESVLQFVKKYGDKEDVPLLQKALSTLPKDYHPLRYLLETTANDLNQRR